MPTTRQMVTKIKRRLPNYSRQQILDQLDEIHYIVLSSDSEQTYKIDPNTGLPPFLTTQRGVFEYECPSDCRRTAMVFSESLPRTLNRTRPVGPQREYYFRARGYYQMEVSSRDKLQDTLGTLTFQFDPGDSSTTYFHLYQIEPVRLTTEDIQMDLPEWVHYLVRDVVIQFLAAEEYGYTEKKHRDLTRALNKIRSELNRGSQARSYRTAWPEELQVWSDYGYYDYWA